MKKKKKRKLKSSVKVFLILVVVLCIAFNIGKTKYEEYLYKKTSDYAILQLGYSEEDLKLMNEKLSDSDKWHIANDIGNNEFIMNFIKCDYFLSKNIDSYLSLTVTKDEDFWHYKKPDYYNYDELVAKVNVKVNNEYYTETKETDMSKGYGILVNKYHYLPENYAPEDLVNIDWKYRFGGKNDTIKVREEVYNQFLKMWQGANEAGFYLMAYSGYRSIDHQKRIYNDYANKNGISYADSIAARPGFSEHSTGLALDIYSKTCSQANLFKDTEVYKWLLNNSYKYGFILRYPEGKSKLTGYNFESWHYRYVGEELAEKVYNSGLTYDEYYAFYLDN
ncbi:MAG: M15 family metallopeptidase [Bacilli bacterium]|nr:M15 family metallopeptidase [Bacilli bacterium]